MPNNEFGDFQTPLPLAKQCLELLSIPAGARILEPTCGVGNFLRAAKDVQPHTERVGIELQREHANVASKWGEIINANIFATELNTDIFWRSSGYLYIVGNPPWITSAELSKFGSTNLPAKANFKRDVGLTALLGEANFDVCEYIILKCLRELQHQPLQIAMLCKTQVARNIITQAAKMRIPITDARLYRIDAKKWFTASVSACFFVITVDMQQCSDYTVSVFPDLDGSTKKPTQRFGIVADRLVSDINAYRSVQEADGKSSYVWRSGLKHDAAAVFELDAEPHPTRFGVRVDLEAEYLFPLAKSTDIFRGKHNILRKWVIVPQKTFNSDTNELAHIAPKIWKYLNSNKEIIDSRRSKIYRNRPRFSVFGHGEYTYAPYKVAVSGLHKEAIFRLVTPINGLPVVLDDTCYFLPFDDVTEAAVVTALLNSTEAQSLIESLVFWDAKRPITKKLLSRIVLEKLSCDTKTILRIAKNIASDADIIFDQQRAEQFVANKILPKMAATLF